MISFSEALRDSLLPSQLLWKPFCFVRTVSLNIMAILPRLSWNSVPMSAFLPAIRRSRYMTVYSSRWNLVERDSLYHTGYMVLSASMLRASATAEDISGFAASAGMPMME